MCYNLSQLFLQQFENNIIKKLFFLFNCLNEFITKYKLIYSVKMYLILYLTIFFLLIMLYKIIIRSETDYEDHQNTNFDLFKCMQIQNNIFTINIQKSM